MKFVTVMMSACALIVALAGCATNSLKGTTWYFNEGAEQIGRLRFIDSETATLYSNENEGITTSLQYKVDGETVIISGVLGMGFTLTKTTRDGNKVLHGTFGNNSTYFYPRQDLAQKEIDEEKAAKQAKIESQKAEVLSIIEGTWITEQSTRDNRNPEYNVSTINFTADKLTFKPDSSWKNANRSKPSFILLETETTIGYRIDDDFRSLSGFIGNGYQGTLRLDDGRDIRFELFINNINPNMRRILPLTPDGYVFRLNGDFWIRP